MAYRLYDIFNLFVDSTQVVGAESFEARFGFRTVGSNNDGFAGQPARDKTRLWTEGELAGQDIGGFGTLIGLFEAAESLSVLAEGKIAGDASKSGKLTLLHAKLVAAQLSFQPGQHARTRFAFRGSVAAASDAPEDEVTLVEVASKAITHAARYRGVTIKSAVFTPDGGSAITPLGVTGLDLNVRWQPDQAAGDDDYGESVEVAGAEVTGQLGFQDATIVGAATVGQRLVGATFGVLVITYTQQGGQGDKTLTLSNLAFEEERHTLQARKFAGNTLPFGCFLQNGATEYKIGSGATKIIAVA